MQQLSLIKSSAKKPKATKNRKYPTMNQGQCKNSINATAAQHKTAAKLKLHFALKIQFCIWWGALVVKKKKKNTHKPRYIRKTHSRSSDYWFFFYISSDLKLIQSCRCRTGFASPAERMPALCFWGNMKFTPCQNQFTARKLNFCHIGFHIIHISHRHAHSHPRIAFFWGVSVSRFL